MIDRRETSLQSRWPQPLRRSDKSECTNTVWLRRRRDTIAAFCGGMWTSESDCCQNHSCSARCLDCGLTFILTECRRDFQTESSRVTGRVCISKLPEISTMASVFVCSRRCYMRVRMMTLKTLRLNNPSRQHTHGWFNGALSSSHCAFTADRWPLLSLANTSQTASFNFRYTQHKHAGAHREDIHEEGVKGRTWK